MTSRILITGASGQLGQCLITEASNFNGIQLIPLNQQQLNITDDAQIVQCLQKIKPDIVINCAAYTAVDKAEMHPTQAMAVNAIAVERLAHRCYEASVPLVQISTDYVFAGNQTQPYTELDNPQPINVYGCSKLAAEQALNASPVQSVIVRTGWLYSEFAENFVKKIMSLAKHRQSLNVVSDQFGTPTYARHLAKTILILIQHPNFLLLAQQKKLFHFTNNGVASWSELAQRVVTAKNLNCSINPVTTFYYAKQVGGGAARPAYTVLDCSNIETALGLHIAHWPDALHQCLQNCKWL